MPDIQTVLPARSEGGSYNVSAPGDFVFVKYTDAPVKLVIDNTEPVTITTGDKRRPSKRFNSFLLENPHDRPIAVVLYVGEGDFDSQIIQGEVSVVPGVRGVDGQWRDDTRYSVSAFIEPLGDSAETLAPGVPIYSSTPLPVLGDFITTGENLVAHAFRDIVNGGSRIQFIDNRCRIVRERSELDVCNGNDVTDIAWHPRRGWVQLQSGRSAAPIRPTRIVLITAGASQVVIDLGIPTADTVGRSLCVGADGLLYLLRNDQSVLVFDVETWAQVKTFTSPEVGTSKLRWDADQGVFWVSGTSGRMWKCSKTFEVIDQIANYPGGLDMQNPKAFAVNGNYLWARQGASSGSWPIGLYPIYTVQRTVALSISRGSRACRDFSNMVWRAEDAPIIDADVTLARVGNAVLVTGEVIKAAIMAVTGRSVGDDYLDHVYAFEYSSGKAGLRSYVKQTGGRSFSAAGIADAFSVEFPAEVKLTIDDGLPLGSQFLTV